tara:strand:+ start:84 stop:290 length:207 start_codon:yes stop_codon:yes gene_type:complete
MKYLIILLLLAGCANKPATTTTKPKQVNLIKVCDTFGAVRHCEMMTEEEAQMFINRRMIQMINRSGRW